LARAVGRGPEGARGPLRRVRRARADAARARRRDRDDRRVPPARGRRSLRPISRRTVLRGVGAGLALPWLELPKLPRAAPLRMLFVYTPNGVNLAEWTPRAEGPAFEL